VVLGEDTLKMTNGIRLLFADDAGDKSDNESQVAAFLFLFKGTLQR
jgi:hypothetical protein